MLLNVALGDALKKKIMGSRNVISFSGGPAYTYQYTSAHSFEEGMDKEVDMEVGGGMATEDDVSLGGFGVAMNTDATIKYNLKAQKTHAVGRQKHSSVSFTLQDDDIGDMFDVAIYKDPVYGTPVFRTTSGRSMCPHEAHSISREKIGILFDGGFKRKTIRLLATEQSKTVMFELSDRSVTGDSGLTVLALENPTTRDLPPLTFAINTGGHINTNSINIAPIPAGTARRYTLTVRRPIVPTGDDVATYTSLSLEYWSECEYNLFVTSVGALIPFDGMDYGGWVAKSSADFKTSPTTNGVTFAKIDFDVVVEPYNAAPGRLARSLGRDRDANGADGSPVPHAAGENQAMADALAENTASTRQALFMAGAMNVILLSLVAMRKSQQMRWQARARRPASGPGAHAAPRLAMATAVLGLLVQLALSAVPPVDIIAGPIVCDPCDCETPGLMYCGGAGLTYIPALPGNDATRTVSFADNDISSVEASNFAPVRRSEAVEHLIFDGNPITVIGPDALTHMTRLVLLSLARTSLRMLAPDVLAPFPLLIDFDASETLLGLVWLHLDPFSNSSNLQSIRLRSAGIRKVTATNFGHLHALRTLDLVANNIDEFADGAVSGMLSTQISTGHRRQLLMDNNPTNCSIENSLLSLVCVCGGVSTPTGSACLSAPCESAPIFPAVGSYPAACADATLCTLVCPNIWFELTGVFGDMLCLSGAWVDPNTFVQAPDMECANPVPDVGCSGSQWVNVGANGSFEVTSTHLSDQQVLVWRHVPSPNPAVPDYWIRSAVAALMPGSTVELASAELLASLAPDFVSELRPGDILCGEGNVSVASSQRTETCQDPQWIDSDYAFTSISGRVPADGTSITVVAMRSPALIYSDGVQIDTLQPWQSSEYGLSGSSGAFMLDSSAPVLAGTICPAFVAPSDLCNDAEAYVYLGPTENRTNSVRVRNTGNTSQVLYLFRLEHELVASGALAKPPHWRHVALGTLAVGDDELVWDTDSVWPAADVVTGGDVMCSTLGNIHVSGDADREHIGVDDPLTSCSHRFWTPAATFVASAVNVTMPLGAHALKIAPMTESTAVSVTVVSLDDGAGEVDLIVDGWRAVIYSNLTAGQRYNVQASARIALSFACEEPTTTSTTTTGTTTTTHTDDQQSLRVEASRRKNDEDAEAEAAARDRMLMVGIIVAVALLIIIVVVISSCHKSGAARIGASDEGAPGPGLSKQDSIFRRAAKRLHHKSTLRSRPAVRGQLAPLSAASRASVSLDGQGFVLPNQYPRSLDAGLQDGLDATIVNLRNLDDDECKPAVPLQGGLPAIGKPSLRVVQKDAAGSAVPVQHAQDNEPAAQAVIMSAPSLPTDGTSDGDGDDVRLMSTDASIDTDPGAPGADVPHSRTARGSALRMVSLGPDDLVEQAQADESPACTSALSHPL